MKTSKVIIKIVGGLPYVYATPDLVGKTEFIILDTDELSQDAERPKRGYNWERIAEGEIENKQVLEVA